MSLPVTSQSRAPSLEEILAEEDFVRSLARSLLRDPNQAEDLVQHGLSESLQRPAPRRLRSYLSRIVRNRAVDLHREETRRSRAEAKAARNNSAPSAAEIAEKIEVREGIAKAVGRLPDAQQISIWLRFFEDKQPREIARIMSVPVSTVHTRIQRGIETLRLELADSYGDWRQACLHLESLVGRQALPPAGPHNPIITMALPLTALLLAIAIPLLWYGLGKNPAADFDFILGDWNMTARTRAIGGAWQDLPPSRSEARRSADGAVIIENWDGETVSGVMIRTYDAEDDLWRILWTNSSIRQGMLQVWEGRFANGVGEFIGGQTMDGPGFAPSENRTKITFSEITADSLHWSLYRSRDDAASWHLVQEREYRRAK